MNKFVDSTSFINKDYSGEYFVQLSSLSLEEIIRIKEYVDKECMNYWNISQNPEGNMIAYSSWKFYNSKDLDNFIHKTLRKNIKGIPDKRRLHRCFGKVLCITGSDRAERW